MSEELRKETAYFMRRLYKQGLTTTSGGNISVLTQRETMLITPSATDKGRMSSSEIGEMNFECQIVGKSFKPSIESRMHLEIYKNRPDVKAVVHAHPVHASAFAALDTKINTNLLAESHAILGNVCYAPYFLMGSVELAIAVGKAAAQADCVIMLNHGALAVGRTLLEAFDRLEVLEAAARMTFLHLSMNGVKSQSLGGKELAELDAMMGRQAKPGR